MVCLDDFTHHLADEKRAQESVDRTIQWSARAKAEFDRQLKLNRLDDSNRPLLLAPIQGHRFWDLRQKCADGLLKIGFDGYGLGGWPFDPAGKFDYEFCQRNARLTPDDKFRFALGVGTPENIRQLALMGYHLFDCVLPTRDARHKRLYIWGPKEIQKSTPAAPSPLQYHTIYCSSQSWQTDFSAIDPSCDCPTCTHYSRAYLYHLFKVGDALAHRLATLHNLRFYARWMQAVSQISGKSA